MHTRTKNICKTCRDIRVTHKGDTIKSVYSHSIIRFHFSVHSIFEYLFSAHSSFEYLFSAHSSFEHLFLPIRVSDFWKSFYRKIFFCFKNAMFMHAHYDKQNHVKLVDTRETTKIVKNVNVMHAHLDEQNMEKVNTSKETTHLFDHVTQ
jgi:hypothetical protein